MPISMGPSAKGGLSIAEVSPSPLIFLEGGGGAKGMNRLAYSFNSASGLFSLSFPKIKSLHIEGTTVTAEAEEEEEEDDVVVAVDKEEEVGGE